MRRIFKQFKNPPIMKKTYLIILLCCLYTLGFAQTNDITVFTENGEAFTLFVNSAKQNDVPAANVKAKNISGDSYVFRLVFLDKSIPELTGRYFTEERNVEVTMMAKQNNKGKWNLAFRGESPKVMEAQSDANRERGSHHNQQQNNKPATTDGTISMNINDGTDNVNINMTVTETGIGIQTNTGEESINLNMNMSVGGITTTTTMTTTTTTTTTTSGSSISSAPAAQAPAPAPAPAGRCAQPMSAADFREAQGSIDKQKFSDTKQTLAKQIIKISCPTSDQVRDLLKLFTFENDRIEIAKYAYEFVYDADKYYKVNDAFQYSSSVDELNKFINSR